MQQYSNLAAQYKEDSQQVCFFCLSICNFESSLLIALMRFPVEQRIEEVAETEQSVV
jgi:hypothetical protein